MGAEAGRYLLTLFGFIPTTSALPAPSESLNWLANVILFSLTSLKMIDCFDNIKLEGLKVVSISSLDDETLSVTLATQIKEDEHDAGGFSLTGSSLS